MTFAMRGFLVFCLSIVPLTAFAEYEDPDGPRDPYGDVEPYRDEGFDTNSEYQRSESRTYKRNRSRKTYSTQTKTKRTQKVKRKYYVEDTERVDAGVFHVGFAVGGNFFIEPKFDTTTRVATGEYFQDFGFQGGVFFDFDYDDIGLGLRGFGGYKYILNSVHVFAFDASARYLFTLSENAKFGLGIGPSMTLWIRTKTDETSGEEVVLIPFFIIEAGFDFNPFMVDFKFPIHRIGNDTTILGLELYFGVRL